VRARERGRIQRREVAPELEQRRAAASAARSISSAASAGTAPEARHARLQDARLLARDRGSVSPR
jgi:hypothetical protein